LRATASSSSVSARNSAASTCRPRALRHFVPEDQKLYTWWSYRAADWRASDRGRRLDHIWVSPDLAGGLSRHIVFKDARDWPKASDHVPVMVELTP